MGLGAWGLCALERLISTARDGLPSGIELDVHVVEPGTPGSGVYSPNQPDYLLLNNPCGQLSLYPFAESEQRPRYGVGLYEWALAQGYGWDGDSCVLHNWRTPIEPHHFLPRRIMGEYLQWFYDTLVSEAPKSVVVAHHRTSAVDLISRTDGDELVCLANGEWLLVDHVIVTSGHTANADPAGVVPHIRQLAPYPVDVYSDALSDGAIVGVAGFGLVAVDVVSALTIGRGGRYVQDGDRLRYVRSGREPTILLYSRSGLPFTAKSVTGVDRTDVYRPIVCTADAFRALTRTDGGERRQVDVRNELLPLMFAEMHARYYAQAAYQDGGLDVSAAVRERLASAWKRDDFDDEVRTLAERYGEFDPAELFLGPDLKSESSDEYQRSVYAMLEADLREAEVEQGYSPVKSAAEVFRIFRDPMRSVVEYGGLSLDSYLDFNADLRSRITRLIAGPPALRSRQFLALMDAGILRAPFGPAPSLGPGKGTGALGGAPARLSSTLLTEPHAEQVDVLIKGHLEEPRIDGSASVLLRRLNAEGRISQFRYGSVTVGSIDLTAEAHPVSDDGRAQERIWMFGVLTEGVRHFTHYIPSPKSRFRAVEDIGDCIRAILGSAD